MYFYMIGWFSTVWEISSKLWFAVAFVFIGIVIFYCYKDLVILSI